MAAPGPTNINRHRTQRVQPECEWKQGGKDKVQEGVKRKDSGGTREGEEQKGETRGNRDGGKRMKSACGSEDYCFMACGSEDYCFMACGSYDYCFMACGSEDYCFMACGSEDYCFMACGSKDYCFMACGSKDYCFMACGSKDYCFMACGSKDYCFMACGSKEDFSMAPFPWSNDNRERSSQSRVRELRNFSKARKFFNSPLIAPLTAAGRSRGSELR